MGIEMRNEEVKSSQEVKKKLKEACTAKLKKRAVGGRICQDGLLFSRTPFTSLNPAPGSRDGPSSVFLLRSGEGAEVDNQRKPSQGRDVGFGVQKEDGRFVDDARLCGGMRMSWTIILCSCLDITMFNPSKSINGK